MTSRTDFKLSDWRVLLDGVEVPHLGVTVFNQVNSTSRASIAVAPDDLILRVRPQTTVHIFAKDEYVFGTDGDRSEKVDKPLDEEDRYRLYWEGVVVGVEHTKADSRRACTIQCASLFVLFEQFKAFSLGLGHIPVSSVISGSSLLPIYTSDSELSATAGGLDLFSLTTLVSSVGFSGEKGLDEFLRDSVNPKFADRLLRMVNYVCANNSLLRQHVTRYRLLDKICGVSDSLFDGVLGARVATNRMQEAANSLNTQDSVMDLIKNIQSFMFYTFSHVTFPFRSKFQPKKGQLHPFPTMIEEAMTNAAVYKFPKIALRNDFVFHPETCFALPPPCNFIFPDQISSMSIRRSYLSEPTRYLVQDPFAMFGGLQALTWMAPPSIVNSIQSGARGSGNKTPTSAQLFGTTSLQLLVKPSNNETSAYISENDGTKINTLALFSDEELEKGIVTGVGMSDAEQFTVTAASVRPVNSDPVSVVESLQNNIDALSQSSDGSASYRVSMTEFVNYIYQINKYSGMVADISLSGHRWLVVGWPTIIMDKDMCYLATISSVVFTVSTTGLETTVVTMDKVRPVPKITNQMFKELSSEVLKINSKVNTLETKEKELEEAAVAGRVSELQDANKAIKLFSEKYSALLRGVPGSTQVILTLLLNNHLGKSAALYPKYYQDALAAINILKRNITFIEEVVPISEVTTETATALTQLKTGSSYLNTQVVAATTGLDRWVAVGDEAASVISSYVTAISNVSGIVDNAITFIENNKEAVKKGAKEGKSSASEDRSLFNEISTLTKDIGENVEGVADRLAVKYDFAVPPSFFNTNLINTRAVDGVYTGLFGCQPFYSTIKSNLANSLTLDIDTSKFNDARRLSLALDYLKGLLSINSVYPIFTDALTDESSLGWEFYNKETAAQMSSNEWATRNFLRREGTTLSEFIKDNGFKLTKKTYGVGHTYWLLTPSSLDGVWDNTILSKLVDDKLLSDNLKTPDPAIRELRRLVNSSNLSTVRRQEALIAYAVKHYNSLGFDGT